MTRCSALLLTIITAALSPDALAFNELFARGGPLSHLTKADVNIALAEIRSALETGTDGNTHAWSNRETQASGTVTPTKTFTMKGMRCRAVDFTTRAGGESGASTWTLCKTKDGWKVLQ
jgi:surface antigen